MNKIPEINVGIVSKPALSFIFHQRYRLEESNKTYQGACHAQIEGDQILFDGTHYRELHFKGAATNDHHTFSIQGVVIGIDFHWEREEDQTFEGELTLVIEEGKLRAINTLSVERYLCSVISSEMAATSNTELLKAHTVISRSWVLSQIENKGSLPQKVIQVEDETMDSLIKWYDRDDHTLFDVCADDHCQRYQGITRITAPLVEEAVHSTCGEVLTSQNTICDTRFSKCCGGISERFENCWQDEPHSYLVAFYDHEKGLHTNHLPADLTQEEQAQHWIRTSPEAFCNTQDKKILQQVLNHYDQETADFYRWKMVYTQEELQEMIQSRLEVDLGHIMDLVPIRRGPSGRIVVLEIKGSKKNIRIGKELEIRKTLSKSHLYSSAFVVDKEYTNNALIPGKFILRGAGWGHGVGLCQIGAAVMSEKGYSYQDILAHYFRGSLLEKRYE